ncbi:MAG: hypothetical protein ACYDHO_06190 [Gaiellaceae bacterium]
MEQDPAANGLSESEARQTLATSWDALTSGLSDDWSDLLVELELSSSVPYHSAALIVAPLNPGRCDGRDAFRFRVGRAFGYGAAAALGRRCLERLDEHGIEGRLRLLEVLSQRRPFETQGPVWRIESRSL